MKTIKLNKTEAEARREIERAERALVWSWVALGLAVFWSAGTVVVLKLAGKPAPQANLIGLVIFCAVWLIIMMVGGMCCSVPDEEDGHVVD